MEDHLRLVMTETLLEGLSPTQLMTGRFLRPGSMIGSRAPGRFFHSHSPL